MCKFTVQQHNSWSCEVWSFYPDSPVILVSCLNLSCNMRTSRISREAAKVAALSSTPRRQTRSQLAAQAPKAIPNGSHKSEKAPVRDADGTDSQSLSSTTSQDIEDDPFTPQSSRKRKRGTDTPSTTLTATSTTTTIRKSPRKIKGEVTEEYELDEKLNDRTRLPKARPQPSKKATDPDTGEVTIHPPGNWEEMYSIVQKMRKRLVAPVDTMGCERAADVQLSAKVPPLLLHPYQLDQCLTPNSRTSASKPSSPSCSPPKPKTQPTTP